METENSSIFKHLFVHAVVEIAQQQRTVQRPRIDGGVDVEIAGSTHKESLRLFPVQSCSLEVCARLINLCLGNGIDGQTIEGFLQILYVICQIGVCRNDYIAN